MKRALFDTVTVLPFASGNVVDRIGYESAVLAVTVEASQTATIKVETADSTAGPYEPVKDSRIFVDNPVNEDGEAVIENEAEAQAVANLDIDLIGCKSCVKITATNEQSSSCKGAEDRRNPACGFAGSPGKGRSVNSPSDGKSLSEGFYLEVSCWP